MTKKIILIVLLVFTAIALLYLPENKNVLYFLLFIPLLGFVIKEFKKNKPKN